MAVSAATPLKGIYESYQKLAPFAAMAAREPFIPGEGPVPAPVMMIGEAPGLDESIAGFPFVGKSWDTLGPMLEASGLPPRMVFFTTAVKYRPTADRDPFPYEIEASLPCLISEIMIVRPVVIAALGPVVLRALGEQPEGGPPRFRPWTTPGGEWNAKLVGMPSVREARRSEPASHELFLALQLIGGGPVE